MDVLRECIAIAADRTSLWARFIGAMDIGNMAEIGVFKSVLAEGLLRRCPSLRKYYMIDPWCHLN